MRMRSTRRLVLGCVAVAAAGGCRDVVGRTGVYPPVAVTVAPDSIAVGEGAQAVAVVHDGNGDVITSSRRAAQFESADPAVARVDATSGSVVGVAVGQTEIVARFEGRSGRAPIVVRQAPRP